MLNCKAQKNEMALDNENCIVIGRGMDKESCKMEPRSQHQVPNKKTSGKAKKGDGKTR